MCARINLKTTLLISVLLVGILGVCSYAQEGKTWTGSEDSNWSNGNNWSPTGEPNVNDAVYIPDTTTTSYDPIIYTKNAICRSLTIGGNGFMDIDDYDLNCDGDITINGTLTVSSSTLSRIYCSGDWTNNGTFEDNDGIVRFDGDSDSTIGGTNPTSFNVLRVQKADITDRVFLTTDNCNSSYETWVDRGTLDFSNADVTFTSSGNILFSQGGFPSRLRMDANDLLVCGAQLKFQSGGSGAAEEDITGGVIRFTGPPASLIFYTGTDFTPTGGTVEIDNGSEDNYYYNQGTVSLYNLHITGVSTFQPSDIENATQKLDISNDLIIDSGSTLNMANGFDDSRDSVDVAGDWTNDGTFNAGTGTVTFVDGTASIIGGSSGTTFYKLAINKEAKATTVTQNQAVTVSHTEDYALDIQQGTFVTGGNDLTVSGQVNSSGSQNGKLDVTVGGTVNLTDIYQWNLDNFNISGTPTVTISGYHNIGNAGRRCDISGGTINYTSTGTNLHLGTNSSGWGWFATGGTISFSGSITTSFFNIYFQASGSAIVKFVGSTSEIVEIIDDLSDRAKYWSFNDLRIEKTGGANVAMISPGDGNNTVSVDLGTVTINSETELILDTGFSSPAIGFDITDITNNGTLTISAKNPNVWVSGNWTNNDIFNAGSGTVTFDGTGELNSGGITANDDFYNVQVSSGTRTMATNSVKIDGKLGISSGAEFEVTTGGLALYTGEGGATDVDIDGTLKLQLASASGDIDWYVLEGSLVDINAGATGIFDGFDNSNMVYLRSSTNGNTWYLNDHTPSSGSPFIKCVDVKDSDATPGYTMYAYNSTNSGNNFNWNFLIVTAIYVDANATGLNNGLNWADAYNYLQDGLADANSDPDVNEIWVADGTYTPDSNSTDPDGSGSREATFQLINGVAIYGGFAGGETSVDERDWTTNETILSGDLDSNDVQGLDPCDLVDHPSRSENSYHVVIGSGTDANTILDGFTITAGNANGPEITIDDEGGGMYNYEGSPAVANCTFNSNSAESFGGGMLNNGSSSTVTNCTFSGNWAGLGGGIYNYYYSNPTVTNCTFSGNWADYGGGTFNYFGSDPNIINCTFNGNSATGEMFSSGGGMYNYDSNATIANCTFSGNSADCDGGGMENYLGSPTVTNCTFSENTAENYGGGTSNYDSNAIIANSILWGNSASDGNEIALFESSTIDVNYCDIQGGQADIYDDGSGNTIIWGDNIDSDPYFVDPNGPDGIAGTEDDNLRLSWDSNCIDTGDNNSVPEDIVDLDNDANTTEPIPLDLDGRLRIADGDCNDTYIVDMGAYEFSWVYIGDFASGCDVDFKDFAVLALTWLLEEGEIGYNTVCDISLPADAIIDEYDLKIFTDNWLSGK